MTDELDIEALLEAPFRKNTESRETLKRENGKNHRMRTADSRSRSKVERNYSHSRSPSRSPRRHREHREHHQERREHYSRPRPRSRSRSCSRSRSRHRHRSRSRSRSQSRRSNSRSRPHPRPLPAEDLPITASLLTESQRDRRTVFCRQLAQRLEPRELKEFCEEAGKVRDVRIVFDKVSRRSKGVAYVEFYEEESVPVAVALSGKKLFGIPIIIELTETEKNRIAEEAAMALKMDKLAQKHSVFNLSIGNLNSSIGEADLRRVFQPFGEITFVQLSREDALKSIATIYFRDQNDAKQAYEKMNGFELAGRPIRIQLREATLEEVPKQPVKYNRDYLEEEEELGGGMDMLLRQARDTSALKGLASSRPSPCVLLQYMYNPTEESAPDWEFEIAEEVKEECSKFGQIEHIHVPKTAEGDVFLRFGSSDSAQATVTSLNGRWFGGRQIVATFIPRESYLERYPGSY